MKKLMKMLAGTALALSAITASAQAWPTKPVKIIVPFPAGGLADILARQLSEELGKVWKQPVVVENRAGAGTMIAGEATAKSAPDGYTLLLANDATISSNQYIYKKMPYDPVNSFVPIINIAASPIVMIAGGKFPGQTLQDVVAAANRAPEKINYGTFGIGSTAHVDAHSFMALSNTKLTHVPYKGVSEVMLALPRIRCRSPSPVSPRPCPLPKTDGSKSWLFPAASDRTCCPMSPPLPKPACRAFRARPGLA